MGSRARRRRLGSDPSGPYVPSLRIVGTTWRERGFAYRWRRFWYAVFLLLVTAVLAVPGGLALNQLRKSSTGAFWVLLGLAVGTVLAGALLEWRASGRRLRSASGPGDYRLAALSGLILWLGWVLLPVGGGIVLAVAGSVFAGPMVAQFVRACVDRELWPEREWRLSGLSPAERRRAAADRGWLPARVRGADRLHEVKPDSSMHPHE